MSDDLENGLDWLRNENDDDDDSSSIDNDDLDLDWLQDSAEDGSGLDDEEVDLDRLSWIQDETAPTDPLLDDGSEDFALEWQQDSGDDETETDEEEVPGWLHDAAPLEAAQDAEVPGWLDAVEDDAEEAAEAATPGWLDAVEEEADETDEEEVPGWLHDAAPFEDDQEEAVPDWLDTADEDEEEAVEAELPDWMQDSAPVEEEEALAEEEAPDQQPVLSDTGMLESLFDDTSGMFEEAVPEGESALDDLFADMDKEFAEFAEEAPGDLDDLFGEETFDREEAPASDLLSEMAEAASLDDLLGEGDFDLLSEMAADADEADAFDLFGELTDEAEAEPEFADIVFPDELPDDDDLLDDLFDEEEEAEAFSEIDNLISDAITETTKDTAVLDEEVVADLLSEAEAAFDEDEEFSWFDEAEAEPAAAASVEEAEWLGAVSDEMETAGEGADLISAEYANVDDFLASLDDAEGFSASQAEGLAAAGVSDLEDLFDDDLLEDLDEEEAAEPEEPPIELAPDAPEWMTDLAREEAVDEHSAAAVARQQEDRPLEQLSERLLALRSRGLSLPAIQEATGMTEVGSVVADLAETLPPIALEAAESGFARTIGLTDQQRVQSEMLREVVGSRGQDEAEDVLPTIRRRRRARLRVERFIIAMALIAIMALPFFDDVVFVGNKPPTHFEAASPQQRFFDQVDALQPGQRVLIAAEYGPTGAGELDPATAAVLRHTLVRQAYPVIVGGNPVGLLHVNTIIKDLTEQNEEGNRLVRNQHYTVGRYLVADAIGLRQFAETIDRSGIVEYDLWGEETGLQINSIDEFALIVVIAENPERLRAWAEQVAPITNTPLLVVTGYSAAPLSEPYIEANDTINGMLVGYQDAYTYNTRLDIMLGLRLEASDTPTATPTSTPTDTPTITPTVTATVTEAPTVVVEPTEPTTVPLQVGDESATPDGQPTEAATTVPVIVPSDTPAPSNTPPPTSTPRPSNTPAPSNTPLPTHTPTATATPEPVRFAVVIADSAINVRDGADTTFEIVGTAQPGEQLLIIGENEDASWYNVLLPDSTPGWVAAFLVRVDTVTQPPATESADAGHDKNSILVQSGPRAKAPNNQGDDPTPEATEETPPTATNTPTVTPTPTITPTPTPEIKAVLGEDGRMMAVYEYDEGEYRDERWYSMTLGIIVAAVVIALGALFNMVRFLAQGVQQRRQRH